MGLSTSWSPRFFAPPESRCCTTRRCRFRSATGARSSSPGSAPRLLRRPGDRTRHGDVGGGSSIAAAVSLAVEGIEAHAERVLAGVPEWIWDGESLPVPVEDIVDSCFGLLVRDVEDLSAAPGCPKLEPGHTLSGLLLTARGEIWVNAD